jgi:hypothetical protein
MPDMKIPVAKKGAVLETALLTKDEQEEATRYLLVQWSQGEISTRVAAACLGLTYYDFTELASKMGYSVSGSEPTAVENYLTQKRQNR